jgi:hypothetical protein
MHDQRKSRSWMATIDRGPPCLALAAVTGFIFPSARAPTACPIPTKAVEHMSYPPPPSQGPYGYQGQAPYGGMPVDHPQGTTVLVLGILSLVICGLLGPVAWVMGSNALQEIDRNPLAYSNRSSVVAGKICGIIATVLLVIGILFAIVLVSTSSSS